MEVDISGAKVFFTTPIDVPLLGELQISAVSYTHLTLPTTERV